MIYDPSEASVKISSVRTKLSLWLNNFPSSSIPFKRPAARAIYPFSPLVFGDILLNIFAHMCVYDGIIRFFNFLHSKLRIKSAIPQFTCLSIMYKVIPNTKRIFCSEKNLINHWDDNEYDSFSLFVLEYFFKLSYSIKTRIRALADNSILCCHEFVKWNRLHIKRLEIC